MTERTRNSNFVNEMLNSMKLYPSPFSNFETLFSSYQQNIDLVNKTQKRTSETAQIVFEMQEKYLKQAFDRWNEEIKNNFSNNSFEEKATHQTETATILFDEMLNHLNKVNSIIAQSNKDIIDSIQNRFQEGHNELANLVKKGKNQN